MSDIQLTKDRAIFRVNMYFAKKAEDIKKIYKKDDNLLQEHLSAFRETRKEIKQSIRNCVTICDIQQIEESVCERND